MSNKLLLSYEGGYGDNGFDLVEIVDDKNNKKFIFMMSYDFGGSLNFVDLLWGLEDGNEEFIKECKELLWEGLDGDMFGCDDE